MIKARTLVVGIIKCHLIFVRRHVLVLTLCTRKSSEMLFSRTVCVFVTGAIMFHRDVTYMSKLWIDILEFILPPAEQKNNVNCGRA